MGERSEGDDRASQHRDSLEAQALAMAAACRLLLLLLLLLLPSFVDWWRSEEPSRPQGEQKTLSRVCFQSTRVRISLPFI